VTKEEALQAAWTLYNRYPDKRISIIDKLPAYGIDVDEFNAYDSTMNSTLKIDILDKRSEVLADIPGFSQVESMSDDEILRVFEARDELNARIEDIGSPPTDAEWYKAGLSAEERIDKLRPFYQTRKEEEWEQLEYPLDPIAPLMGPLGLLTEVIGGGFDLRHDFKEDLHEQGAFTSWNPLTGFGAWDIAEFKTDPATGRAGFSPELLQMEDELEQLYGTKRQYNVKMQEGGYRDVYGLEEELGSLDQIIMENKLLDPRLLGETQ
tara:strand:- start:106 stop:900 length:795 start_codon:yes stop_codon:yes gene_type:complete